MKLHLDAATTAIVTMECQRGVIGDLSTFPALATSVRDSGALDAMAAIVAAGRECDATVVHALAVFRADRGGSFTNAPLLRYTATIPGQLEVGTPAAELVAELGPEPSDLVSARHHGVSPFTGTDLDALLRSRGVRTVVPVGVSLNVGMLGLCIEAVNLGYEVVLATDATAALPASYADAVLTNTFSQLATLCEAQAVIAAFNETPTTP
ncbi:MAG: cysteine hydrolase [Microthrixaceae bacterium]|nr:cysteine hydrolase [Microthrixaceae bacterium]MCO5312937.1 cysteine hydrolase [Microthrixaceae bacterium]